MYGLNKTVWILANPLSVGVLILGLGVALKLFGLFASGQVAWKRRVYKSAWGMVGLAFAWLWLWGTAAWTHIVGYGLEKEFLVDGRMRSAADYPIADAIVDLGGGCGANTNVFSCVQLNAAADRAYFSAQLWKAGKAPMVIPSGTGLDNADRLFMMDLGVPEESIVVENAARNTEENAKFVRDVLCRVERADETRPTILLVTSAWHMKRSLLMFARYAAELECIPAVCDFECVSRASLCLGDFLPNPGAFECNSRYFHEWLGIWGYKCFRR